MNKRANKAYPKEKINAKERWPQWEAVETEPGDTWYNMMGLRGSGLWCVVRHRDPRTGEILNRPELAAGPFASKEDAEEVVATYETKGEPK